MSDELQAELGRESGFVWSRSRPLGWADFAAAPPSGGTEGAHTVYSLLYGFQCTKGHFDAGVMAAFLSKRSWVLPEVLADPALGKRTLNHEQTHFNLTEVYARRLRLLFASTYNPCGKADSDLRAVADQVVSEERDDQARYDQDTAHGLNHARQAAWDRDVHDLLASLQTYMQ